MKTFCFKLYHSDHNNALMRQINIAGLIYNHCVALHKRYYRLFGKLLNANHLKIHLTKLKRTRRFEYMRKLGSQVVQDIAERIDRAYSLFFENVKRKIKSSPPKFRRVKHYKSFTLKQAGWKLDELRGHIKLGKKWYGYFQSRKVEGKVKTLTVKRDAVGDIYIYLVCETQSVPVESRTGKSVGFDFGLKTFLAGSDDDIESPDFFMQNIKTIKAKCRNISYKQKGSHNRKRARLDLARAYRRIKNQRKDFHFKTARKLCEEYACICLETLNIKGMARILEYKAVKLAMQTVFIDRLYPSTQMCSVCGYKNLELKDLHIREWDCQNCGTHHDRGRNAAKNINMAGAYLRCATLTPIRGDALPLWHTSTRPEQSGSVVDTRIPCLCWRNATRMAWGVCQVLSVGRSYSFEHTGELRGFL